MTELGVTRFTAAAVADEGLRPVNLRTDLNPLAQLIELVFADSMDSYGRSAIREMRALSRLGYGLHLISRLNELTLGISMGYVYVADGELVGNVSVYPSGHPKDLGATWILANIGVHPDFRRRGVGGELVAAAVDMIKRKRGKHVILQVNYDNAPAVRLYERLGFIRERAWRNWRRGRHESLTTAHRHDFHITRLRDSEWRREFELAQMTRPNHRGGLGWLKPVHRSSFYCPPWKRLLNLFSLCHTEKLVIREEESGAIAASCWIESSISTETIRLRLFAAPSVDYESHAEALLRNVINRYPRSTILIEHPRDDEALELLLRGARFQVKRDLWHMRLDL